MAGSSPTLRGQLLRWLLIPLSILFLLDASGSYFLATRLSDRVHDAELVEIARELALHVRRDGPALTFDLEKDAERTLLLDQYDTLHYAVRDEHGARIAGDAELPIFAQGAAVSAFRDSVLDGAPVRVAELHMPNGGDPIVIQVASTKVGSTALAREIIVDIILPQLVLILIAGAIVWIGVARGLLPLRNLQQAVAARSHRDLSPVVAAGIPGEVNPLLSSINDLLARLDEVLSVQNRFIADAAHQLRTPVAGLKAHIEVALREQDPARMRQALAQLYIGVERMSRLVAQLLSLARNEPTTVKKLALQPLDLAKLAFDVTTEWVPHAYARRIDLGFEGADEHVMIAGDTARLSELINNLLDNAIRYSHEGGRVTVRVTAKDTPRLSVSDDGPTIPVGERERVFERFHRLLGSHADGSGLGLAIVREIASLHEATIRLDDDVDGVGNTFTIEFPAIPPSTPAAATP
jgi:two-component system sensor histidine kinase TctE